MCLTKRDSKFKQMSGEAATAVSLWRNIGHYVSKSDLIHEHPTCLFCNKPTAQAEHLVNKAQGGNHTIHNVIPVCKDHIKPNKRAHWKELYTPKQVQLILSHCGEDDEARLNPYHNLNAKDAEELRHLISTTVHNWRTQKGLI